jgi:UDP-glucose 4-epimerase
VRYLVTGGAGFIGSHLADDLAATQGNQVIVLDDLSTGNRSNLVGLEGLPNYRFVQGTLFDEELVRKLVGEVDVVVHLAASVGVQLIVRRPLETLLNNIRGTEVVLQACADESRKVLVASTSEIYGKNVFAPLHEDADRILGSTLKSRWAYSTSKAVDEILAYAYWRDHGTPTIIVRLFNTVGPRQTGDYGMVIPRLVGQALRGDPLTVFGTGEQLRSFCHVLDTVAALRALLENNGAVGDVFNIGSPQEISINELAARILALTGSSSPVEHIPYDVAYERGFEDMERRVPVIDKISGLTGWRPTRDLTTILDDVVAFERERLAVG